MLVPVVFSGDGNIVRTPVNNVKFLNTDLVDLVQHINARDVDSVTLDDVNELVDRCIAPEVHVAVRNAVLGTDRFDSLVRHVCHLGVHRLDHVHATFVFPL